MDILHLFQRFISDPRGFGQLLIITALGIMTFLIAFTVLSRDLSKDLEKLPKEIPTDNLFDPQHFFDGKTQKVLQEMFHYSLDQLADLLVDRWKLNDTTSPIHHIVLMVDITEQSVTTIISEQLSDILTPEKRDELNDLFAKSFKGTKFDSGLRTYMDELDYFLHMTRQQKETEKRDQLLQEIKENQESLESSVHTQTLLTTLNLLKK